MIPPIPTLQDYGISPSHGFLPMELPLDVLPDPYYGRWEAIASNLQALILSKRLRGVIDRLPILSTVHLQHPAEWRRAYSILSFMTHAYIWGGDRPEEVGLIPITVRLLADCSSREYPRLSRYLILRSAPTLSFLPLLHTPPFAYGISSRYLRMSLSIPWIIYLHSPPSQALWTNHGSI